MTGRLCLLVCVSLNCHAVETDIVSDQLIANFRYLVDTQIRCGGNYDTGTYICNKSVPGERRIQGSWDSHIVPVAIDNQFELRFVDSNLFVTAQTILPLFGLQFANEELERIRQQVIFDGMTAVNLFRRDDGYAFWPQLGPSRVGQVDRIGPLNLSPLVLSSQIEVITRTERLLRIPLFPKKVRWMQEHIDLENKEIGIDALFSVPNDADDTALGIISNYYFYENRNDSERLDEISDLSKQFAEFRDALDQRQFRRFQNNKETCTQKMNSLGSGDGRRTLFGDRRFLENCSLDDTREYWRYDAYDSNYSGAFLTWLYDETKPIYNDPGSGIALPGQNSVDCTALANVLYSLALTEARNDSSLRPGYVDSCNAIANVIIDKNGTLRTVEDSGNSVDAVWRSCGLFFPAHMTFPYMVSRAVSDGGACLDLNESDQLRFDRAMRTLVAELATEQDAITPHKVRGQWYDPIDGSVALPTALGAVSLLNFKTVYGVGGLGKELDLDDRLDSAMAHVVAMMKWTTTADGYSAAYLPEGTYFGGGTADEIAHWRSEAFATAVSLELASKYLGNNATSIRRDSTSTDQGTNPDHALRHSYVPDRLPPLDERSAGVSASIGILDGNRGTEISGEVTATFGDILSGSAQEPVEQVAHYKLRLNASANYHVDANSFDNYHLDVRFLGINTYTSFIVRDDVGHLPITLQKLDQVTTKRIHVRYGEISAPFLRFGDKAHLNFNVSGRLFGAVRREQSDDRSSTYRKSINLADISAGVTVLKNRFTASLMIETALGVSSDSDGVRYSSHKNYRLETLIRYSLNERHRFTLSASKSVDGGTRDLFDDNRAYLKYERLWGRL